MRGDYQGLPNMPRKNKRDYNRYMRDYHRRVRHPSWITKVIRGINKGKKAQKEGEKPTADPFADFKKTLEELTKTGR